MLNVKRDKEKGNPIVKAAGSLPELLNDTAFLLIGEDFFITKIY